MGSAWVISEQVSPFCSCQTVIRGNQMLCFRPQLLWCCRIRLNRHAQIANSACLLLVPKLLQLFSAITANVVSKPRRHGLEWLFDRGVILLAGQFDLGRYHSRSLAIRAVELADPTISHHAADRSKNRPFSSVRWYAQIRWKLCFNWIRVLGIVLATETLPD